MVVEVCSNKTGKKRSRSNVGVAEAQEKEEEASSPKKSKEKDHLTLKLDECIKIVENSSSSLEEKAQVLTQFLSEVYASNANILAIKEDFHEWLSPTFVKIIQTLPCESSAFFKFCTSCLHIVPTLFEPQLGNLFDRIFPVILISENKNFCDSYTSFLGLLKDTYVKLRRFPKLVAKLICSLRSVPSADVSTNFRDIASILFPIIMTHGFEEAVCNLPTAQIIDLWKTLQYNFSHEILRGAEKLTDLSISVLSAVIHLYCLFLNSFKIPNSSSPKGFFDKCIAMLNQMKTEGLALFAKQLLNKTKMSNIKKFCLEMFLKISFLWGELRYSILCYNQEKSAPEDLKTEYNLDQNEPSSICLLHNYFSSSDAQSLFEICKEDEELCKLFLQLLEQKLRFMILLKNRYSSKADFDSITFNDIHEVSAILTDWLFLLSPECITLSSIFISSKAALQISSKHNEALSSLDRSSMSPKLQYALILSNLQALLARVKKVVEKKRFLKKFLSEYYTNKYQEDLVESLTVPNKAMPKEQLDQIIVAVNQLICEEPGSFDSIKDIDSELIMNALVSLKKADLERFPVAIQVTVALFLIPIILICLPNCSEKVALELLRLLASCSQDPHGNEQLFSIKWERLLLYTMRNQDNFSSESKQAFMEIILSNIYVSPSKIKDLRMKCLSQLKSNVSINFELCLIILNFLTKRLEEKKKSKVISSLKSDAFEVVESLLNLLMSKVEGRTSTEKDVVLESLTLLHLEACSLSLACVPHFDSKQREVVGQMLMELLPLFVNLALKHLNDDDNVTISKNHFLMVNFFHLVVLSCGNNGCLVSIKLSVDDVVTKFWQKMFQLDAVVDCGPVLKVGFEVMNDEELRKVVDVISGQIDNKFGLEVIENELEFERSVRKLCQALNSLLEAKLETADKKRTRRSFVEQVLMSQLHSTLYWERFSNIELLCNVIFETAKFQTKIMQRRLPIGSLNHQSLCLSTITAAPLTKFKDVSLYKKVFCGVADLLNALTLHRLDVLSFKTHVYLQCFQHLMESLICAADQKNKLSDGEIFDLRHCAFSIERLCQSIKQGRREFSRIAPYFLVTIFRQLERFTVYPTIKSCLLNGSYKLLDLCDEYGIGQLNSMLTIGSRELFKSVYDVYQNFYRYKGKV